LCILHYLMVPLYREVLLCVRMCPQLWCFQLHEV
jgi:hypothetical protein